MLRPFLACSALSLFTGCGEELMTCPGMLSPRVVGTIVDTDGEPLVPDRVYLVGNSNDECEIDAFGWGGSSGQEPGHFSCYGSGDRLVVYIGNESVQVDVPDAKDECGLEFPDLRIVFE